MKRPVFIVGCPRSGTTLLYSFLLAAGGFAVYRKETYFFDLLHRFPDLSSGGSHQQFLGEFLQGYLGSVPGLDVEPLVREALNGCRTPGDFLPRLMNRITSTQGMERWVEGTPVHVMYLHEIKQAVPDALFIHVIRDGRDCALSNDRQHWVGTLPWDRGRSVGVAALFWEWMVRTGRADGRQYASDYFETRFEDLIASPRETLARLGQFIDHDLDYDRIQQHPVHAMTRPNSSFKIERERSDATPVGRWKTICSPEELELCERLVGRTLEELDYPLAHPNQYSRHWVRPHLMRALYVQYFSAKHRLKAHTPLGRWMTSTRMWAQRPHPREGEVFPIIRAAAAGADGRSSTPTVDS
jgi:Sulfotransferase family